MHSAATPTLWRRIDDAERSMCLKINRGCRRPSVRAFFTIASRLGDGAVWYALMAVIAVVDPPSGWRVSLTMAIAGSTGVMLYRHLKTRLVRQRPSVSHAGILCGATPLDRYSFPSGHTLHAVNFTILAATQYPLLLPILTPL